jgi:hypothetical protein
MAAADSASPILCTTRASSSSPSCGFSAALSMVRLRLTTQRGEIEGELPAEVPADADVLGR